MRKARGLYFCFLLGACSILTAFPAIGQISPFGFGSNRSERGLSGADLDLLGESVGQLNRNAKSEVGTAAQWSNPATGSHGNSVITRMFTNAGRPCHDMRHELFPRGRATPRIYNLTWCRIADGTWKIKS